MPDILILTARVEQAAPPSVEGRRYVARIESVSGPLLEAWGESPEAAQEELIQAMLGWISSHDCAESMAGTLAAAGFPGIDDDTELQLEFAPGEDDGAPGN